jgi:hypothetical protein
MVLFLVAEPSVSAFRLLKTYWEAGGQLGAHDGVVLLLVTLEHIAENGGATERL